MTKLNIDHALIKLVQLAQADDGTALVAQIREIAVYVRYLEANQDIGDYGWWMYDEIHFKD